MKWLVDILLCTTLLFAVFSQPAMSNHAPSEYQRLTCFFYDKKNPYDGMGVLNAGLPSVWAKGLANEDIYVVGTNRDGFFKAHAIKGQTQGVIGFRLVANYENSQKLAEHFCKRGLKFAFPESHESKALVHVGVRTSFLSLRNTPVVFKHFNNNSINTIDKIVVFGDSLSDQGNLKHYLRIFPNAPYFAGRFSNHFVWIDHMQKLTGISVQNWAIGGSISDTFFDVEFNQKPLSEKTKKRARNLITGNLADEIAHYQQKSLNNGHVQEPNSTLFSIWIGGNDYTSLMESPTDVDTFLDYPDDQRVGSQMMVQRVTDNIIESIKKLHALGARHFIVANLPDLGKLPRILQNQSYHAKIYQPKQNKILLLSNKMTAISNEHNRLLKNKTENLQQQLLDLNIVFVDVSKGIETISNSINMQDGISHFDYDIGAELASTIPMGNHTLTIQKPCYTGNEVQTSNALVCKEPHRALFWDKTHPSSYTHCLIAAYIHQQAASLNVLKPVNFERYLAMCRPELVKN